MNKLLLGILGLLLSVSYSATLLSEQKGKRLTKEQMEKLDKAFNELNQKNQQLKESTENLRRSTQGVEQTLRDLTYDLGTLAGMESFWRDRCNDNTWKSDIDNAQRDFDSTTKQVFNNGFKEGWKAASESPNPCSCEKLAEEFKKQTCGR